MGTHVIHAEWIGKHVTVKTAKNKLHEGMEGVIVDETKNTLSIETTTGVKRVPKHGTIFLIDGHEVSGEDVLAAPEERIKLKVSATDVAARITRR